MHIILVLISIVLSLALGEGMARFGVRRVGDPLQRSLLVLEPDLNLGWRQQGRLNTFFAGTEFYTDGQGFRISTPNADESFREESRILILGPSSTVGWGVKAEETYAALVAAGLGAQSNQKTVINAGEIGYSLVQGERLYRALRRSPAARSLKTVVLAFGINDLDRFRFYGRSPVVDAAFLNQKLDQELRWDRFVSGFALMELFLRAFRETSERVSCGSSTPPPLRHGHEDFRQSLDTFVAQLTRDGIRPILINTPYFYSTTDSPEAADIAYMESAKASADGRCGDARTWIKKARTAEPARIARDVLRLNALIRGVARKNKLALVDAAKLLRAEPAHFHDAVHPSVLGHQLIADDLLKNLALK